MTKLQHENSIAQFAFCVGQFANSAAQFVNSAVKLPSPLALALADQCCLSPRTEQLSSRTERLSSRTKKPSWRIKLLDQLRELSNRIFAPYFCNHFAFHSLLSRLSINAARKIEPGSKCSCKRQILQTFRVNCNLQDTCPVYAASRASETNGLNN